MKIIKRIFLTAFILSILAVVVLMLVMFGPLSSVLNEKPEDGSKWVYSDFTFETDSTENAGITMAQASAADVAHSFKNEVYDLSGDLQNPPVVTYYDYLTFDDGTINLHHYKRTTTTVDGIEVYSGATEETSVYGSYDGKNITVNDDMFEDAYIRDGVLYIRIKTYHSDNTFAILTFKPAE